MVVVGLARHQRMRGRAAPRAGSTADRRTGVTQSPRRACRIRGRHVAELQSVGWGGRRRKREAGCSGLCPQKKNSALLEYCVQRCGQKCVTATAGKLWGTTLMPYPQIDVFLSFQYAGGSVCTAATRAAWWGSILQPSKPRLGGQRKKKKMRVDGLPGFMMQAQAVGEKEPLQSASLYFFFPYHQSRILPRIALRQLHPPWVFYSPGNWALESMSC